MAIDQLSSMATRDAQVELLCGFYARHDAGKSRAAIEEIIDKRRGAEPALSWQRWSAISAALEKKYGEPLPSLAPQPQPEPEPEPQPEPQPTTAPRLGAGLSSLKAARAATVTAVSAAGAAALTAADKTGVSAVADKAGLSAGLSVGLSAGLTAAGKAAAGLTARTTEQGGGGGAESGAALAPAAPAVVEPEPEPPTAEELAAVEAERQTRLAELGRLEPAALATMVVAQEAEVVSVRAKAKRLMLEMVREKDSAIVAARDGETAAAAKLSEATRRAEVRQKRVEQLQRDLEQQQAELSAWEKSAEESSATGQARVQELEGEVRDLREALTAAGAESASRLRGMHREVEASRAEHAQLQVEVAELAAALAGSERAQQSWKERAEAAEAATATATAAIATEAARAANDAGTGRAGSIPAESSAGAMGSDSTVVRPAIGGVTGGLEEDQLAVVEGRVLRERCATLEARARAAETKADEARRTSAEAQSSADELLAAHTELEARHKEMVKAWVGAQPAAEAEAAMEKAEAQQAMIDELEMLLQQKEQEITRLRSLASQELAVRYDIMVCDGKPHQIGTRQAKTCLRT